MAKLKRKPAPSPRGRAVSVDTVVPLSTLVDCSLAEIQSLSPSERATWLALRREIGERSAGAPFDPRKMLTLSTNAYAAWAERRALWIAGLFADDPRVTG